MGKAKQRIGFKINVLVTIALLLLLSVNSILATEDVNSEPIKISDWQVVGPSGGDVRVVAVDPRDKNRLYISTLDGQIHTSADGGKTWRLLVNLTVRNWCLTNYLLIHAIQKLFMRPVIATKSRAVFSKLSTAV